MAFRVGGAPGLVDPSSLSLTAATTRIVAVACTLTDGAGGGAEALARATAAVRIIPKANAVVGKW